MNMQREVIYGQRNQVLDGVDLDATMRKMIDDYFTQQVDFYCSSALPKEEWNVSGMLAKLGWVLGGKSHEGITSAEDYKQLFLDCAYERFDAQKEKYGPDLMEQLEQMILLQNVDRRWMDHIDEMEELKGGIYLRSYGQQDPVVAFRMESFDMFDEMSAAICEGTVTGILTVQLRTNEEVKREQQAQITGTSGGTDGSEKQRPVKKEKKIGRNEPCPCGSGKKYKHCCGKDE
jgi:preprotein translocase subunit SecA